MTNAGIGRRLRSHRTDPLLEHAAVQRDRARRDVLGLLRRQQLPLRQQVEQLLQGQRGTQLAVCEWPNAMLKPATTFSKVCARLIV